MFFASTSEAVTQPATRATGRVVVVHAAVPPEERAGPRKDQQAIRRMIGVLCSEDAVSSRVATLCDEIYDEKRGERATALSGERIGRSSSPEKERS